MMLKRTIAYSTLAAVIVSAVLVPATLAKSSMAKEIISIANNGRPVKKKKTYVHRKRAHHWKTTVYDWRKKTHKEVSGCVPPAKTK